MNRIGLERTPGHIIGYKEQNSGFDSSLPVKNLVSGDERVRNMRVVRIAPHGVRTSRDFAEIKYLQELCSLHDLAGDRQRELLERYPYDLPTPLINDPEYYDGAQFYMLNISRSLESSGLTRQFLSPDQHMLLVSSNGLNDWWLDESFRKPGGERDYEKVIEAFDAVNAVCYPYLQPGVAKQPLGDVSDPEIDRYRTYYQYVLDQMPEVQRGSLAKLLISINLYQGLSLYQERAFREHIQMGPSEFEPTAENMDMMQRMQLEKGGIAYTYFWPYYPQITDDISIPATPPAIQDTIQHFLNGNSIYPTVGMGRRILEIGEVNQKMDDSCDCTLDLERGVTSPENLGIVYVERAAETWDERIVRIKGELGQLKSQNDDQDHALVVDAGVKAVDGLTLFRANRTLSKKENNSQLAYLRADYQYKLAHLIGEALDPSLRTVASYVVAVSPYVAYEQVDIYPHYGVTQKIDPRRRLENEVPLLTLVSNGRRAASNIDLELLTGTPGMEITTDDDQRSTKYLGGQEILSHFLLNGWIDSTPGTMNGIKEVLIEGEIPQYRSAIHFESMVEKTL